MRSKKNCLFSTPNEFKERGRRGEVVKETI
jgi:hypothetical protein